MARKPTAKQLAKQRDQIIEQIYRKSCSGMQISVLRIPELFRMAGKMVDEDKSYDEIGQAMVAFVQAGASP